jgi:hypothetical protein
LLTRAEWRCRGWDRALITSHIDRSNQWFLYIIDAGVSVQFDSKRSRFEADQVDSPVDGVLKRIGFGIGALITRDGSLPIRRFSARSTLHTLALDPESGPDQESADGIAPRFSPSMPAVISILLLFRGHRDCRFSVCQRFETGIPEVHASTRFHFEC